MALKKLGASAPAASAGRCRSDWRRYGEMLIILQFTVRHVAGKHPTRVVIDPRGRVPVDLALFTSSTAPTLHLTWAKR